MSGRLDKPLTTIQNALLTLSRMRGLFRGWLNEIEILREEGLLDEAQDDNSTLLTPTSDDQ